MPTVIGCGVGAIIIGPECVAGVSMSAGAVNGMYSGAPELPDAPEGEDLLGGCMGAPHSFTGATPVLLADGHAKPIEKVKAGDKVEATDPQTGLTGAYAIQRVIKTTTDRQFTSITITTKNGKLHTHSTDRATLTTTWHHPFWNATTHQWVEASHLTPGTRLREPNGTTAVVARIRNYHSKAVTYDLTIASLHTYYVLAGTTPILVHNTDGGCTPISIYRTPKTVDKDYELGNGPNSASRVEGGNDLIYFGEKSVAGEYRGRGPYAPGMIKYDMHPSFLERFGDTAKRYDWQGPDGSPRIEFEIPYARLDEFNSLTLNRTWLPLGGG